VDEGERERAGAVALQRARTPPESTVAMRVREGERERGRLVRATIAVEWGGEREGE
jgi:hypothetical protein